MHDGKSSQNRVRFRARWFIHTTGGGEFSKFPGEIKSDFYI